MTICKIPQPCSVHAEGIGEAALYTGSWQVATLIKVAGEILAKFCKKNSRLNCNQWTEQPGESMRKMDVF